MLYDQHIGISIKRLFTC